MYFSIAGFRQLEIALGIVASLAWATCLVMAVLRWRAFRQRADVWWVLVYLCLLVVGIGRLSTAALWWSIDPDNWSGQNMSSHMLWTVSYGEAVLFALADVLVILLFAGGAVMAVFANRRRPDAFDV